MENKTKMRKFQNVETIAERFELRELAGTFCAKIDSKTYSVFHEDHFEVWQKLIRSPLVWSWYP